MPFAPGIASEGSPRQRDQLGHLRRADAVALAHAGLVDALGGLAALRRDEHRRAIGDQLVGVAVGCHHDGRATARKLRLDAAREQVVGLEWRDLGRHEPERLGELRQHIELLGEVAGEGRSLPLVARQQLVAVALLARVEREQHLPRVHEVVGRDDHVGNPEQQARGAALVVRHGRHRVVGAMADRVSVDHEQGSGSHPRTGSTTIATT